MENKLPEKIGNIPVEKVKIDNTKINKMILARKMAEKDKLFFKKVHLWFTEVLEMKQDTKLNIFAVLEYVYDEWKNINKYYELKQQLKKTEKKRGNRA